MLSSRHLKNFMILFTDNEQFLRTFRIYICTFYHCINLSAIHEED